MADFEGKLCEEIQKYPHMYDSLLEEPRSGTQGKESGEWTCGKRMCLRFCHIQDEKSYASKLTLVQNLVYAYNFRTMNQA